MDNINIKHVVDSHTLACIKIDEDNDIYEMAISKEMQAGICTEIYTLDNVYESKYGDLFDELNMAIEIN